MRKREELPSKNELVIGTITRIFDHGAFVTLDEYGGLEAYVPLNEVSRSWFRGIREVLKIGQKRVFKVIRVIPSKKQVDVSLKRVSDSERRAKIKEWKRAQRAEKLLEVCAERLGKTLDEAYEKAGWPLEDYYGEIFAGLEEAALRGVEALKEAGVKEPWASALAELAKMHIKISRVKISGIFTITCLKPDGVARIRKIFEECEKILEQFEDENVKGRIYTVGAPRYRVDIEALDYKTAEAVLDKVVNCALELAKKFECSATFERIKKR